MNGKEADGMLDIRQAIKAQESAAASAPPERIEAEYRKLAALRPGMKEFLGSINFIFQDRSMHGLVPWSRS